MNGKTTALQSVAAEPPDLQPVIVAQALARDFGLSGELRQLVSERDQNFRLRTADGSQFVAKIVSSVEDPGVTNFQVAALLHLEAQGTGGVPRIVRSLSGDALGAIQTADRTRFTLRVTSWLDGKPMEEHAMSTSLASAIGQKLGQLDLALSGFEHADDDPLLLWDMQRAAELVGLTEHISSDSIRRRVQHVLENFRDHTSREIEHLPRQVIHNDANPSNLLLTEASAIAVIDFGDIMRAARVIEVATAASYLRAPDDPLNFIVPFVAAYHRENALQTAECKVLYDLIRTRLAMTISILYWRMSVRDADDPYRQQSLASEQNAIEFLEALEVVGRSAFNRSVARELEGA